MVSRPPARLQEAKARVFMGTWLPETKCHMTRWSICCSVETSDEVNQDAVRANVKRGPPASSPLSACFTLNILAKMAMTALILRARQGISYALRPSTLWHVRPSTLGHIWPSPNTTSLQQCLRKSQAGQMFCTGHLGRPSLS